MYYHQWVLHTCSRCYIIHYLHWILPRHTPVVGVTVLRVLYHGLLFRGTRHITTLPSGIWSEMIYMSVHKEQDSIPVGLVSPTCVVSQVPVSRGGGRYPSPGHTPCGRDLVPEIPTPPRKDMGPQIPTPPL